MSEVLTFYPMLSERHLMSIGYTTDIPLFSYTENYEEFPLTLDGTTDSPKNFSAKLRDTRCSWYPETHDLIINKKCVDWNVAK